MIAAVAGIVLGMAMSRRGLASWFFDPIESGSASRCPRSPSCPSSFSGLAVSTTSRKISMVVPRCHLSRDHGDGDRHSRRRAASCCGRRATWVPASAKILWQICVAGGAPPDHHGVAGCAADRAHRGGRDRDAHGRLRAGRRDDRWLALCRFPAGCSRASWRSRSWAMSWSSAWHSCPASACCCGIRRLQHRAPSNSMRGDLLSSRKRPAALARACSAPKVGRMRSR